MRAKSERGKHGWGTSGEAFTTPPWWVSEPRFPPIRECGSSATVTGTLSCLGGAQSPHGCLHRITVLTQILLSMCATMYKRLGSPAAASWCNTVSGLFI